jgi:hypothetical protein
MGGLCGMYFMRNDMDAAKKEVIINCPKEIVLEVSIPDEICCEEYEKVADYMYQTYHIDIDVDEESDYFENLFFNQDLRSQMGWVMNWCPLTLYIKPQYFASNLDRPDDYWTKKWKLLIENSLIMEEFKR